MSVTRSRLLLPILCSLILGMGLNILVAWWAVLMPQTWPIRYPDSLNYGMRSSAPPRLSRVSLLTSPRYVMVATWDRLQWGEEQVTFSIYEPDQLARRRRSVEILVAGGDLFARGDPPHWSRGEIKLGTLLEGRISETTPEKDSDWGFAFYKESAAGFPFVSLWKSEISSSRSEGNFPQKFWNSARIPARVKNFVQPSGSDRLPLRPLPLGFVLNTLFYAGIVFGTWESLSYAKRTRRRRRRYKLGLCTECAHPLEGLPEGSLCPECGVSPSPRREPRETGGPDTPDQTKHSRSC